MQLSFVTSVLGCEVLKFIQLFLVFRVDSYDIKLLLSLMLEFE